MEVIQRENALKQEMKKVKFDFFKNRKTTYMQS